MVFPEQLKKELDHKIQIFRQKAHAFNTKPTEKEFEEMYEMCRKLKKHDSYYNYFFYKVRMLGDMPEGASF